jgi:hypothetical protein
MRQVIRRWSAVAIALTAYAAFSEVATADTIGRANLDGSGVDPTFITGKNGEHIAQLALAGSHIYWVHGTSRRNNIARADLEGSEIEQRLVPHTGLITSIAANSSHIYWSWLIPLRPIRGLIGRANLDGTEANPAALPGDGGGQLAADDTRLYWGSGGHNDIGRVDLDGTHYHARLVPNVINPGPAVAGGYIYWRAGDVDPSTWSIGRANLDGSDARRHFITKGVTYPLGVAADASHIYWTNGEVGKNTIGRADLDGGHIEPRFIATRQRSRCHAIGQIAVDSAHIYWTDFKLAHCLRKRRGRMSRKRQALGEARAIASTSARIARPAGSFIARAVKPARESRSVHISCSLSDLPYRTASRGNGAPGAERAPPAAGPDRRRLASPLVVHDRRGRSAGAPLHAVGIEPVVDVLLPATHGAARRFSTDAVRPRLIRTSARRRVPNAPQGDRKCRHRGLSHGGEDRCLQVFRDLARAHSTP